MRFEVLNGDRIGTVEWRGPGDVAIDMADPQQASWFSSYFQGEESVMWGPVDCAEMSAERRDSSFEAFQRATFRLAAYAYTLRADGDGSRSSAYAQGSA